MDYSTFRWNIYSVSDPGHVHTYLTNWADTAPPSYSVRADGVSALTLSLPWLPGVASQVARRRIGWGYHVYLQVTTRATREGATPAVFGQARFGAATFGSGAGLSRTLGKWLIHGWEERPPREVSVSLVPLSSEADEPIADTLTLSGCVVELARRVVEQYASALTWDGDNPAMCDAAPVSDITFDAATVRQVLEALVPLAGTGWFVAITADGRVRFRPEPAEADHRLTAGHTAIDLQLSYDGIERRKEIIVRWAGGETPPRRAADWVAAHPYRERITAEHLTTEGDALRLAELALATRDTLDYRGAVLAVRPYPIETLQVGDGLILTRTDGSTAAGAAVYGQATFGGSTFGGGLYGGGVLAIGEVAYEGLDRARVTLAKPRPDFRSEIARLMRRVETLRAQVA